MSDEDSIETGGFGSERDPYTTEALILSREGLIDSLFAAGRFLSSAQHLASEVMVDDYMTVLALTDAQRRVEKALALLQAED